MADPEDVEEEGEDYFSGAPEPPQAPEYTGDVAMIALTPAQQQIVEQETGRRMGEFPRGDESGFVAMTMRDQHPDDVTIWAIDYARRQNEYELAYQEYLIELAAWQDTKRFEEADAQEAIEEKAASNAEALAESYAEFYAAEADAKQAAVEAAIEAWDPDGKKRKKGLEPG